MLVLWRYSFSAVALAKSLQKRILIVGAGKSGRRLLLLIKNRAAWGLRAVGFVDDDPLKVGTLVDDLPVLGTSNNISALITKQQVSLVAVAITHKKSSTLINALTKAYWSGCQLIDMPTLFETLAGKLPTSHISEDWLFEWNLSNSKIYYRRIKRFIDLILSILYLLLTWPLLAIIALLIKLDSAGPVFFKQLRVGQEGKLFKIRKFRTMIPNAEDCGPHWTRNRDPRVTRVGKFLTKSPSR